MYIGVEQWKQWENGQTLALFQSLFNYGYLDYLINTNIFFPGIRYQHQTEHKSLNIKSSDLNVNMVKALPKDINYLSCILDRYGHVILSS